jgi:putative ABC transport system permease protein
MHAVVFRSRVQLRNRGPAWFGLAVLLGIVAGTCMAFGQAAHRTQVTFGEFVREQRGADVVLAGGSGFGFIGSVDLDQVDRLPGVAESARAFVGIPFSGTTDDGRRIGVSDIFPIASADGRLGTDVERWKITRGRAADPARTDEATASSELAHRMHLHVGSTMRLRFYDSAHFVTVAAHFLQQWPVQLRARAAGATAPDPADGPVVTVRIVGVEASPLEFPPLLTDLAPVLHLTPAFAHRYDARIVGSPLSYVRLRDPNDLRSFQLAVERLAKGQPVSFVMTLANQRAKVDRSLRAEAFVLAVVTGLLALTGGVTVAQALGRQGQSEARDDELLRALGMQRVQRRGVACVRAFMIGLVAVGVALAVAWLASPLMLLSLARMATLRDGFRLDASTAVIGATAVLLFALVFGGVFVGDGRARPQLGRHRARVHTWDRLGSAAERRGVPASMALGMRFAMRRRERSAPVVMTMLGAALGVATVMLATTFTATLHRNLDEPARYGWNWDLKLGAPGLPDLASELVPPLRADARVADLSVGTVTQVDIGSTRLDVFALDPLRGSALPTLTDGHRPRGPTEMVLGASSMRTLHVKSGATVRARIGGRDAAFRIVGRAIFPEFGDSGQLGTGAWTTVAGLRRIAPDSAPRNTYLVGLRPSARASAPDIVRAVAPLPVREAARPEDLVNLSRGDGLLVALAALLAALVLAVLLHSLLTAARRDRAELAVLRALGRTRGQTRATVVWQSLTLAVSALVAGIPLGLVAARAVWSVYADHLGIANDVYVPLGDVGLVVGGTLLVALLAAFVPAWLSARGDVGAALVANE